MSAAGATSIPPNDPVPVEQQKAAVETSNGADVNNDAFQAAIRIQQKYAEERDKRLKDDASRQYIDLEASDKYRHFSEDPWLDERSESVILKDGARTKFLIVGGGFGGLLHGIKLIKNGVKVQDIKLVEVAGGLGGTWYWNRYPGLMCDVESYVYLPLLEETGYMPKHRFSYGSEIRNYVNSLAERYGIADQAMFRTSVDSMDWDDEHKEWVVRLTKECRDAPKLNLTVRSQFVMLASGVLLHPKLPNITGIETFKGHSFHTSRWDYDYTGGSPETPDLAHLKGKRVGIVATGATAVQAVPILAKWAKELVVFQRTPAQVDTRGQRETDPEWWQKEVQNHQGWQRERITNFHGHITGAVSPEAPNLVDDEWTRMRGMRALIGGPGALKMEDIPGFVAELHAQDLPRGERVRARVEEIVKDQEVAQRLKSWFPSWCKRPAFHDEYLQTFNQPNVTLVDTDGKGIESLTEQGPVVDGQEYPLDVLVWSTGFRAPAVGSPGTTANMTVTGRNGLSLDDKWKNDIGTLHGVVSRDFPNLFWTGPWQAASSANYSDVLDTLTTHVAHIAVEGEKYAAKRKPGVRYSLEPTKEAEENWSLQIQMRAAKFAGMSGCTPGYMNREGSIDKLSMEERMKFAKIGIWGDGILNFQEVLKDWRSQGKLEGLDIQH